jgi:hypothetical protein
MNLKELPTATPQEVFDYIVSGLLTQNAKSVNDKGECMYRGLNGLKCAGGMVIDDDEYMPKMEMLAWPCLHHGYSIIGRHNHLITELQKIHDGFEPGRWADRLRATARKLELSTLVIDNHETK